jgi:hypothetical protein
MMRMWISVQRLLDVGATSAGVRGALRVVLGLVLALASGTPFAGISRAEMPAEIRAELIGSGRVDPALIDRLGEGGSTNVVVVYRVEPSPAIATPATGAREARGRRGSPKWTEIARGRDRILARLASSTHSLERRFESLPVIAGGLELEGLRALARDPDVRGIALDIRFEVQLAEAVPLVGLSVLHSAGYEGVGIEIAAIDTGVDGQHLDLVDSLVSEQCFCSGNGGCCPGGGSTHPALALVAVSHLRLRPFRTHGPYLR